MPQKMKQLVGDVGKTFLAEDDDSGNSCGATYDILKEKNISTKPLVSLSAAVFLLTLSCSLIMIYLMQLETPEQRKDDSIVTKFKVWGPGLKSVSTLPICYFFIEALDEYGMPIGKSLDEEPVIQIILEGDSRIGREIIDLKDGRYVYRTRFYDTTKINAFHITYKGKHVAESPYIMNGYAQPNSCHCPVESTSDWKDSLSCPTRFSQIEKDLEQHPKKINRKNMIKKIIEKYGQTSSTSLAHYVIKNNTIYRKTYGQHVGFKIFMDSFLLSLVKKVHVPDVEFFLNLGDWPQDFISNGQEPLPVFSWCGSHETRDIVLPTYDLTESSMEMLGRTSLDVLSAMGNSGPEWKNKMNILFWRGRDSRQERLDLVKMSLDNPDVIDARMTHMFFFDHDKSIHGDIVPTIPFFDFFKYKYQLNVDGTVAAYRLPYLLGGGALVLKQTSNYYEHFYNDLKPYKHYVPVKSDLSDLKDKIQWAKDNDEEAKQISENSKQFVIENLLPAHIYCYHLSMFEKFGSRFDSAPEIDSQMELVKPDPNFSGQPGECFCPQSEGKQQEL